MLITTKKKNVRLLHSFITLINSIEFYVKKDTYVSRAAMISVQEEIAYVK